MDVLKEIAEVCETIVKDEKELESSFAKLYAIISNLRIFVERINDSCHESIKKKIYDLDLICKIAEIEGLFKDIEADKKLLMKQSICNSMGALHESVDKMHKYLDSAANKIHEHNQKYFSWWRSVEFNSDIAEIDRMNTIMMSRYERLQSLLKIHWSFS